MRSSAWPVPLATITTDVHSRSTATVHHTVLGEVVYDPESGATSGECTRHGIAS